MAKKRAKKAPTKKPVASDADEVLQQEEERSASKNQETYSDQEVERRISAIRAISDMEIEQLHTEVRLLRSYFNEEQLQVPVLEFFEKNLPNVAVVENDLQFRESDFQMSLLHHMSAAYPEFSGAGRSYSGLPFSGQAGITSFYDSKRLSTGTVILGEPFGSQTFGMPDGLVTPGVNTPTFSSIGMTPKSQRQPKQGELLLSVHGSPLGVYNEDNNMEPIRESDEG